MKNKIELGGLAFVAEDFRKMGDALSFGEAILGEPWMKYAADEANRILAERLAKAPLLYEYNAGRGTRYTWWNSKGRLPNNNPSATARLVCVVEIDRNGH